MKRRKLYAETYTAMVKPYNPVKKTRSTAVTLEANLPPRWTIVVSTEPQNGGSVGTRECQ